MLWNVLLHRPPAVGNMAAMAERSCIVKTKQPDWLTGITRKRPEIPHVLHALVLAGLKKGHVTAESAHHIPVTHPNSRGAAMKYLREWGFVMGDVVRGTTKQSHGHWLHRWILKDRQKAEELVAALTYRVTGVDSRGNRLLPFSGEGE